MLDRGRRSRAGIRGIDPLRTGTITVVVGDLLRHHHVGRRREEAPVEQLRRNHHLVIEVVLLHNLVVGLKSGRSDFYRVGENLLPVLDLLHLVADGLFFVLDLHDGVAGLRGVEYDAGPELRMGSGL